MPSVVAVLESLTAELTWALDDGNTSTLVVVPAVMLVSSELDVILTFCDVMKLLDAVLDSITATLDVSVGAVGVGELDRVGISDMLVTSPGMTDVVVASETPVASVVDTILVVVTGILNDGLGSGMLVEVSLAVVLVVLGSAIVVEVSLAVMLVLG